MVRENDIEEKTHRGHSKNTSAQHQRHESVLLSDCAIAPPSEGKH